MMSKLDELLKEILQETERQKDQRKEYISLIHSILENATRKGCKIGNKLHKENVWKLYFRLSKNGDYIVFSESIIKRNDNLKTHREDGLDDDAIKQLELKDNEMDDAINYLINNDKIVEFMIYLTNKAVPLFLQDQRIQEYKF